jgi:hypothetical protein
MVADEVRNAVRLPDGEGVFRVVKRASSWPWRRKMDERRREEFFEEGVWGGETDGLKSGQVEEDLEEEELVACDMGGRGGRLQDRERAVGFGRGAT